VSTLFTGQFFLFAVVLVLGWIPVYFLSLLVN
jgi:hypothetical protein